MMNLNILFVPCFVSYLLWEHSPQQQAWEFRFACEKVFDFAVDTSKALRWNQPAAAENSLESISWQTHICALKTYKCAMQRPDRWVTGFQKHRYGHALWHNKRLPSAHTYFLCLCPVGHPALGWLEKIYLPVVQGLWRTTQMKQKRYIIRPCKI